MAGERSLRQRWAGTAAAFAIVVAAAVTVSTATVGVTEAAVRDPFIPPIFETQDNAAIVLVGNAQMSCPTNANGCGTARTAVPLTSGSNEAINNDFNQTFLDVDGVGGTSNSTSATLSLPAGSVVLHARLVWGGRRDNPNNGNTTVTVAEAGSVKLRVPTAAGYSTLTSTNTVAPDIGGTDGHPYQASIDVTAQVAAAGNGTYWVADIAAASGADRYAGWSLVVAYRNPSLPFRDLAIFEGFADVTTTTGNSSVSIPVSGFLTPATGPVNATLGFVTWEGDRGLTGEQVQLNSVQLADAVRPATNFFNSGITTPGVNNAARNPNHANNFGVDVANVVANGILPNNATSTTLTLTTNREFFYPGIVTTQIDLYTPAFNAVSKTVTNLTGNTPAQIGDTLQYELTYTNTGLDFADNSVVADVLAANQTFVPGSISVVTNPGGGTGTKTDAVDTDTGEYVAASRTVRVRVGTSANATTGGTIAPNATVTLRFRATLERASAGTSVANVANLAYRARTIARDFTFTGNVVQTPVGPLADLAISKSSSPTSVNAGQQVQYPITVRNNGPTAATGVTMVDTLPAGVTFVSAVGPSGTTCGASGQVVTCAAGDLANGATQNYLITATVSAGVTGTSVVNSVRVSSTTSDDVPANDTASANTAITRSADLVAAKTGPTTATAGAQVTYAISATNGGPSTATTVRLTDPIPVGTTLVSVTPTGTPAPTCAPDGGTVVCTIASLAPGQTIAANVVLAVGSGFSPTSLTNSATATSAITDPTTANNTASVTSTIAQLADVQLTKTVAPATAVAGTGVTYTLVVSNAGPSDAQSVEVNDPAVTGLTYTTAASSRGTCTVGAAVSCAIGLLSPGSSATITVQATVASTVTAASIVNTATASSTTPDPTPNPSATATLNVTRSADLSIVKTGPGTLTANTDATFTLTITNDGPSQAQGVTATDVLPAGLTFVSSPDGCTAAGGTVTCSVGTLGAGTSAVRRFVARVPANVPASVANTATVAMVGAPGITDPNSANNSSTFTSGGANVADIAVTKSVAPTPLVAGGPITYTVVVTNNGPSTASAVALTDTVPAEVTITSVTATGGATCLAAPAVQCTATTLASGASYTVTAGGTIAPTLASGSSLSNTASVAASAATVDPTPANNSATATGAVTTSADVGITLTAVTPTITAGLVERYIVRIVNNGPSAALNVVATGQVPPGLIPIVGSSGGLCVLTDQIVTCNLGTLPLGAIVEFPLEARVDASYPPGPITATAFIGSSTADTISANNQDPETITVIGQADLAMTKTAPATLTAGGEATYTLTAVNNGPSDAATVSITDTLDPSLTLISASPSLGTCSTAGQTVTCTATRLPAGSSMVVSLKVAVSTTAPSSVSNTGSVASAVTADPIPGNNSSSTSTPVTQSAHLVLSKSASPETVVAGSSVTYTLSVANQGPSNAVNVVVSDPLPAGMLILPGGVTAPADAGCSVPTDQASVSCSFATIPARQSRIITVVANVPAAAAEGSSITNTATLTTGTPDPDVSTHTASITTPVTTAADLVMVKTSIGTGVVAGDPHSYQLSITNNGPSVARSVRATDPLPTGTTFVEATFPGGSCVAPAGVLTCELGDLTPGQSVPVSLTLLVAKDRGGTTLTNSASVVSASTPPTADPITANNTSSVSETVNRRADLELTKAITSGPIVAGQPLTYALSVTNNGVSDTIDARISDPLPANTTFTSATASDGGTCVLVPEDPLTVPVTPVTIRCTWATLAVGETRTATITLGVAATIAPGTVITNVARADSAAIDPTLEEVTVTGPVVANSDVSISKALVSGTAIAGAPVRWQMTVRNAGPSVASGVTVADVAPSGVAFTGVTTTGGTCVLGSTPLCTIGTMAVDAEVTVTLIGTITADYAAAQVSNTATVASTSTDPVSANNSATATSDVGSVADLTVVKTAGASRFTAGGAAQWTITVSNAGPSTARSVAVTDTFPSGLIDVSATSSVGTACTIGATVSCPLGNLDPGTSATVTLTGTITPDFLNPDVSNTANVTSGTSDPTPLDRTSTVQNPVDTSADLRVTKTGPPSAAPGEAIEWQMSVTNDGPSVAQAVVVTDQLPPDLIGARAAVGGSACTVTVTTIRCELGVMPIGVPRTITVNATIDPNSTLASLRNASTVGSATSDPDPADNTAAVDTALLPVADLSILKSADAATVVPGTPTAWTIDVSNAGPSVARSVVVTDPVPIGTTLLSAQLTIGTTTTDCTFASGLVTCPIADLAPGALARIRLSVAVDQTLTASPLVNTATVTSPTDPASPPKSSTASSVVVPSADVRISKSVDATVPPVAGGPIRFLISVDNVGPSAAQDVTVVDVLPDTIDPATVTVTPADSCTFTADSRALTCALGQLANGAVVPITVEGTSFSTATEVRNTAQVTSPTNDPLLGNNSSTAAAIGSQIADLSITKTGPAVVLAGQAVTWTLTATNAGPSVANGVVITDTLPPEVTEAVATPGTGVTCDPAGAGFRCTVTGPLPVGQSRTVSITAAVPSGSKADSLNNGATVGLDASSPTGDPNGSNNNASVVSEVGRQALLTVTKAVDPVPLVPGSDAVYTLTISNTGPSDAEATLLGDALDPGLIPTGPALPSQGSCTYSGVVLGCTLGVLGPSGVATVQIPVRVDPSVTVPVIVNQVTVSTSTPPPPGTPPYEATISTPVQPLADLTFTKTGPATITAGLPISWTITASNAGPSVATAVVVEDTLPPGLGTVTITPSQGSCSQSGLDVECLLGSVAPGTSVMIQLAATVPADSTATTLVNAAALTSATPALDGTPNSELAEATTTVSTSADVRVSKRADTEAVPGTPLGWTITVENAGPSVARNVRIADTLPAGLANVVAISTGASCSTAAPGVVCDIPVLGVGSAAAVTVTITSDLPPDFEAETIVNTAIAGSVGGLTPDPDPGNNEASVSSPGSPSADVVIDKTGPVRVVRGTTVEWTIAVSNLGPSIARDVLVVDTIPAGVSGVTATATAGLCTAEVQCVLGNLYPGAPAVEITVTGTLAPDHAGDVLTNVATATSTTADPSPSNESTWTAAVDSAAALAVAKTGTGATVAGGPISWTVTVTNNGPSVARDVTMLDAIPTGVVGVTATSDMGICDTTVTCQLGDLAVGVTATITIAGTVDSAYTGSQITNLASATSLDPPVDGPGAPPVVTEVGRSADVSIGKSLTSGGTVAGGPVLWTIIVDNAGPSTADAVTVTDPLPSAVLDATATASAGSCTIAGGLLNCAVGSVAVGAPVTITVAGTVAGDFRGVLTNTASVSSSTGDPDTADATSTVTSSVGGQIDLTIAKSVDRSQGLIGTSATFTIVATNLGPSSALDVAVDDQLPPGLTFIGARPSVGTFDPTTRRWTVGTLAAGTSVDLQLDVSLTVAGIQTNVATIGQDLPAAAALVAQVLPGVEETRTDNNTASATIEVITGELPATGTNTWRIVQLGALMLALGAGLLLTVRRRRRAA